MRLDPLPKEQTDTPASSPRANKDSVGLHPPSLSLAAATLWLLRPGHCVIQLDERDSKGRRGADELKAPNSVGVLVLIDRM